MSEFVEILKTLQVVTIKLRRFRLQKCYFGVLAVKYKQSGLLKKTLTRFWTANSVKYENIMIGAIKRNTSDLELRRRGKQRSENKAFCSHYFV